MAFKPLTKKGEEFVLNRCLAKGAFGDNRFAGKRDFSLPKSNNPTTTVYTATPVDEANKPITTPQELAKNLISWFNRYSKDYLLDANIIAAQSFAESGYNLWIYSNGGAMGVTQFIDTAFFDTIIKNVHEFETEIEILTTNVVGDTTDIRSIIPNYSTRDKTIVSTKETSALAKNNRSILFQNIINNPRIMIKAQCYIMDFIGERNNNLAASSLFAYNRGGYLRSQSYDELIDKTQKKYGSDYIKEGIGYVNRIFNLLAGKEPFIPVGFGYEIDFTQADVNYRNLSQTVLISGDFPLTQAQEKKVQQLHPVAQDTFRQFIYNVEHQTPFKVQITSGYRTFAEQERIKRENSAMIPPRPASNPGSSYHNYGLALDIAIYSTKVDGLYYSFNKSIAEWKQTGVVDIATKLGLRWGGTFSDQVHFDLGNRYTINECKTLAQNTYGTDPTKVEGNKIPLVA
jgi:peptidoglycan L-alanyl-D-glutamate endopeptidase CwlK